jgi:hypothetical protein
MLCYIISHFTKLQSQCTILLLSLLQPDSMTTALSVNFILESCLISAECRLEYSPLYSLVKKRMFMFTLNLLFI